MLVANNASICAERSAPGLRATFEGLSIAEAAHVLVARERQRGFVAYDVDQTDFFRLPPYRGLDFTVQYVPNRRNRPQSPAACPVCLDAITKAGRGFFEVALGRRQYRMLANPYAFMPSALTVVATDHRPQGWHPRDRDASDTARSLTAEAAELSAALEGYMVIWNGVRAGASLPAHAHFSVFEMPIGHAPLAVAQVTARRQYCSGWHATGSEYPMVFHFARGERAVVAAATAVAMREWDRIEPEAATGNVITTTSPKGTDMYFFPRNVRYPRAPFLAGALGALEVCGSFVLSTDWELEALRDGRINARTLYSALRAVSPTSAEALVARPS